MSVTPAESPTSPLCETCGAPADVHISNVQNGVATLRHFCADCEDAVVRDLASRRNRVGDAAVFIVLGVVVLGMSVLADAVRLGATDGFGKQQWGALLAGGLLLLLGAVTRARTLLVLGCVTVILAALADLLALGGASGYGVHQMLGSLLGVALILAGTRFARKA